jgi:hypothetical protein
MTTVALAEVPSSDWRSTMPVWAVLLMDRSNGNGWRSHVDNVKRMPKTVEVTVSGEVTTLRRRSF